MRSQIDGLQRGGGMDSLSNKVESSLEKMQQKLQMMQQQMLHSSPGSSSHGGQTYNMLEKIADRVQGMQGTLDSALGGGSRESQEAVQGVRELQRNISELQ